MTGLPTDVWITPPLGGFKNCVQALLEAGSNINARDSDLWTPLSVAVSYNNLEAVLCLISTQGVEIPERDRLELFCRATKRGNLEVMRFLISSGADVNASAFQGVVSAPIHVAATYDQADAATLLIDHGCDVDNINSDGWTALMRAADGGCADYSLKDDLGRSSLDLLTQSASNLAGRARLREFMSKRLSENYEAAWQKMRELKMQMREK